MVMPLLPALALCVITPVAALFAAPSMARAFGHDWLGLFLTCMLAVSGPIIAIWTVH